jgi:hypothetical protein
MVQFAMIDQSEEAIVCKATQVTLWSPIAEVCLVAMQRTRSAQSNEALQAYDAWPMRLRQG